MALMERSQRRERRKAERLARRLGVELGRGLAVNGYHGSASSSSDGCGTYELVLNVEAGRVDCAGCGATDLTRQRRC